MIYILLYRNVNQTSVNVTTNLLQFTVYPLTYINLEHDLH